MDPADLKTWVCLGEAGFVLGGQVLGVIFADVHREVDFLRQFYAHFFERDKPAEAIHSILKNCPCFLILISLYAWKRDLCFFVSELWTVFLSKTQLLEMNYFPV